MLLMFSNVKITPKFSVNYNTSQKLYFEPQLFTQQKIYLKETFDKISFQNKVLHQNTGEINEDGIVMLATQKVSRILSHSLKSHREPLD